MLREVGEAIKAVLEGIPEIKQVEFYEGQFEKLDEEIINPPAIYVDYQDDETSEISEVLGSINIHLFIMCSSVERSPGNMLDILESIITALHDQGVRELKTNDYLGRCFYKGSKPNTTFPGLVIREAKFKVERS